MFGTVGEGDILLADRANDAHTLRVEIMAQGAWAAIGHGLNRKRRTFPAPSSTRIAA